MDLAYDQVINGRIWNESYADPVYASAFLRLSEAVHDERLFEGVRRRLQRVKGMSTDQAKQLLDELTGQVQNLHSFVCNHFVDVFEAWMEATQLHPLQRIVWQKQIKILKGDG
jgi:hypothetical protein